MGHRGPAPTPTRLRILKGDPPGRINTDEPAPADGSPVCPVDIPADVRAIWDYTVHHLAVMGIAGPGDRDALLCYCEAVVAHRKASAILAVEPLMVEGHRGVMIRHPALCVQRDAAGVIRNYAHEFGLTPSARSEIRTSAARVETSSGPDRLLA